VLVDIREVAKKPQAIIEGIHRVERLRMCAVVRLHTLDDCKCLIGNPRKHPLEIRFKKRGRATLRTSGPKRKFTVLAPVGVVGGNVRIPLDDFERQMIEGRPHPVNHFPRKHGNFLWRWLGNIQFLFALRRRGDLMGLTGIITGDA